MLNKIPTISFLLILSLISFAIYQQVKIPDGVSPQSDAQLETVAWLALWTAIISLLTSIVGLIQNILERSKREK